MNRDHIVGAEIEVEVLGIEIVGVVGRVAEPDRTQDDEEVTVVRLDLHAAVRVERVFDGQRVEVQQLLEDRMLMATRAEDVDPELRRAAGEWRADLAWRNVERNPSAGIAQDAVRQGPVRYRNLGRR